MTFLIGIFKFKLFQLKILSKEDLMTYVFNLILLDREIFSLVVGNNKKFIVFKIFGFKKSQIFKNKVSYE